MLSCGLFLSAVHYPMLQLGRRKRICCRALKRCLCMTQRATLDHRTQQTVIPAPPAQLVARFKESKAPLDGGVCVLVFHSCVAHMLLLAARRRYRVTATEVSHFSFTSGSTWPPVRRKETT